VFTGLSEPASYATSGQDRRRTQIPLNRFVVYSPDTNPGSIFRIWNWVGSTPQLKAPPTLSNTAAQKGRKNVRFLECAKYWAGHVEAAVRSRSRKSWPTVPFRLVL
jgi:hypothetical protein